MPRSSLLPVVPILSATAFVVLVSCDSPTGVQPGPPAALLVVAGNEQEGVVGQELPDPLVARVVDAEGRPVSGQLVNFVVTAGGGSVFAGAAQTNQEGEARERWTLGTSTAEEHRVEARAVDPATGEPLVFAAFEATPLPDEPAEVHRVGDASLAGTAGEEMDDSISVRVTDQHGNPTAEVEVRWAVTAGGGSLSPERATTDEDGGASALWTLGAEAGENEASAEVEGVGTVSFTADGRVGAVASVTVAPEAVTIEVDERTDLEATLRDAAGNELTEPSVTWTSSDAAIASVSATGRVTGQAEGEATITATADGVSGTAAVTVVPKPVASVVVELEVSAWVVDETVQAAIVVRAEDGEELTDREIQWSRDDESVAGVDDAGRVTTRGVGSATISAHVEGVRGSTEIEVVEPIAGSPFETIAASGGHACGLTPSGAAYCWGWNESGQLGTGDTSESLEPVPVAGGHEFVEIATGLSHTVGLTAGGVAYAWGSNGSGQLGDGTTTNRHQPVRVAGDRTFSRVSAGGRGTVALAEDGAVFVWGAWAHDPDGTQGPTPCDLGNVPTAVETEHVFAAISAGSVHAIALTRAGVAFDLISTGTGAACELEVTPVAGAPLFSQIGVGTDHNLGISRQGVAHAWGSNEYGALGDGGTGPRDEPVPVEGGDRFTRVSAGGLHSIALTPGGAAYGWGFNRYGQLGIGEFSDDDEPYPSPRAVVGGHTFVKISAGSGNTIAVASDGSMYRWGYWGVDDGISRHTPLKVEGGPAFAVD